LKGPLAGKTLADLVSAIEGGQVYVNIDTRLNSAGAIRGDFEARGQDDEQDSTGAAATVTSTPAATTTSVATVTVTAVPTDEAANPGKEHANPHADQAEHGQP
jgi:hypothetical protein